MRLWTALLGLLLVLSPPTQAEELIPGYWERTPLPQTGVATFYAPGIMEYVQDYRRSRGQIGECDECVGAVALLRAGDIGRKVWLQPPGGERVGPFLVVDCAHTDDIPPLLARGWVVDVSYQLGQIWGMERPLTGVTVLEDPSDAASGGPSRAPTPFFVPPDQIVVTDPTPTAAASQVPPTPWPTRLPDADGGGLATLTAATPLPTYTPRPTSLTPIVTTPTPSGGAIGEPSAMETPVPGSPGSSVGETVEVALGRPGEALLVPPSRPTPPSPPGSTPSATPTAFAPTATPTLFPSPAATSLPILPPAEKLLEVPGVSRSESPFLDFWRQLLDSVLP